MADDKYISKSALIMTASLMGFSLIVATTATLMDAGQARPAIPTVAESAERALLVFTDNADGGITVASPSQRLVLEPNTGGFIRGVMRAMAFERRKHEIGPDHPFLLARTYEGRLVLADPATGAQVDLRAFGADNEAAFAALLPMGAAAPSPTAASLGAAVRKES